MPSRNDTIEPQTSRYRYVTRFKGARDAVDIAALVKIPFSSVSFHNFLRDRAVSLSAERLLARVRAEIRRDGIRQAKRTTLHDSLDSRAPIKASYDSAPLDSPIIYSSVADNFATGRVSVPFETRRAARRFRKKRAT